MPRKKRKKKSFFEPEHIALLGTAFLIVAATATGSVLSRDVDQAPLAALTEIGEVRHALPASVGFVEAEPRGAADEFLTTSTESFIDGRSDTSPVDTGEDLVSTTSTPGQTRSSQVLADLGVLEQAAGTQGFYLGRGGDNVRVTVALQRVLAFLRLYRGDIDGDFDRTLERSLRSFQHSRNLISTGALHGATLDALITAARDSRIEDFVGGGSTTGGQGSTRSGGGLVYQDDCLRVQPARGLGISNAVQGGGAPYVAIGSQLRAVCPVDVTEVTVHGIGYAENNLDDPVTLQIGSNEYRATPRISGDPEGSLRARSYRATFSLDTPLSLRQGETKDMRVWRLSPPAGLQIQESPQQYIVTRIESVSGIQNGDQFELYPDIYGDVFSF